MLIESIQNYAFVGIGSNLSSAFGTPKDNVLEAVKRLSSYSGEPLIVSSLLETTPLDCPPGSPDFINAVVALLPRRKDTALNFLYELQGIENSMGRVRSGLLNEARIIDLDLLFFREETSDAEELILPHPEMLKRDFVLEPLKELLIKQEYEKMLGFIKKHHL